MVKTLAFLLAIPGRSEGAFMGCTQRIPVINRMNKVIEPRLMPLQTFHNRFYDGVLCFLVLLVWWLKSVGQGPGFRLEISLRVRNIVRQVFLYVAQVQVFKI